MHRQNIIAVALLAFLSTTVVTIGYAKGWGPFGVINRGISQFTGTMPVVYDEKKTNAAPDFAAGTWINSQPLKLQDLRGRVVLVDFWTFGCYNCRNTLPSLKRWHEDYKDKGLTIVGVHSPELEEERKVELVRQEVASLGIKYPVVTDNDYATWNAYKVNAWPTVFLLDKAGRIRWMHVGEGAYDEAEKTIQKLLAESTRENAMTDKVEKTEEQWRKELSPEQYYVLREAGTERAFTGVYWDNHDKGTYRCAACGLPLFSSDTKFDSGTGWPSFYAPISQANIIEETDRTAGMVRTEVKCRRCGSHLGHVFSDGPRPTGLRYCMNSISLKLDRE
jgi:peptide-methionine (R)-S-oxide reductase